MYSSTKERALKNWNRLDNDLKIIEGPWSLKKVGVFLESIFVCAPKLFLGSVVDKVKAKKKHHYEPIPKMPLDHVLEVIGLDIGPHPDNQNLERICEDMGRHLHEEMGLEVDFAGLIYHFYGDISKSSKKPHWDGYQQNTAFRFVPEHYARNFIECWEYQNGRVYVPIELFVPPKNIDALAIMRMGEVVKVSKDTYYGGIMRITKQGGGFMTVCISPGGAKIGPMVYGERMHLDERKDLQLPEDNPTYLVFNMPPTMRNFKDIIISKFQDSYKAQNRIQAQTI